MKPLPLVAPSTTRRSKKRLKEYVAKHEELAAEVARINRQKRIDAIKRVLRWPSHVWRW